MLGKSRSKEAGICYRTATYLETFIKKMSRDTDLDVLMSVLEIYQEKLIDLLVQTKETGEGSTKLKIREDPLKGASVPSVPSPSPSPSLPSRTLSTGVFVSGLSKREVENAQDIAELLEEGSKRRHVGSTEMNEESSRSHSIVTITLYQRKKYFDIANAVN